jgi:microcin C transport system substrate-binding protein
MLKKADGLLKEAGYIVNKKGLRVHPQNGQPVRFEILLSDAKDEKIALEYARSLRRLGITATIRTVDAAQFSGRLDAFDFDMVSYRWINSLSPGSEQVNYFGLEAAARRGSRNYSGIQSKAIDHLARAVGNALTYDDLKARIGALDRALTYEYLMVPLFYTGYDYLAYKNHLKRPAITPIYGIVIESFWSEPSSP